MSSYIVHEFNDSHFVNNLRLACEWAEPGELQITYNVTDKYGITRPKIVNYDAARLVSVPAGDYVRVLDSDGERYTIKVKDIVVVRWRPDIRRYEREGSI